MTVSANAYLTDAERGRLQGATVGIAGAGGLGSNCAAHLVRAGVGKIVVADFDTVGESNLNRQFYFRDQLGLKKVEALRANLLRIDPGATVDAVDVKLDAQNTPRVFAGCDMLVEALDGAAAKSMFISAALATGKTVVCASGLAGWGRSGSIGMVRVGSRLVMVGDARSDTDRGVAPQSPRVGIAAAMEANAVVALLLGEPL